VVVRTHIDRSFRLRLVIRIEVPAGPEGSWRGAVALKESRSDPASETKTARRSDAECWFCSAVMPGTKNLAEPGASLAGKF
jgi:hypothetical protein